MEDSCLLCSFLSLWFTKGKFEPILKVLVKFKEIIYKVDSSRQVGVLFRSPVLGMSPGGRA